MSENAANVEQKLTSLEETASLLGRPIHDLRAVDNNSPNLANIQKNLNQDKQVIPIEMLYQPSNMLIGRETKGSRFVFSPNLTISETNQSSVCLGLDRLTGEYCAAKVLRAHHYSRLDTQINLFQHEADRIALLNGDPYLRNHVVQIYDFGFSLSNENGRDVPSMVLFEEYLGPDEYKTLADLPTYDPERPDKFIKTLKVFRKLATVLERMVNEYGIFYDDLKDSSLLIGRFDDNLKLLDFNGGYNYQSASPELALENHGFIDTKPDLKSVVFAFASLFYYKLAGKPPFDESVSPLVRPVFKSEKGIYTLFEISSSTESDDINDIFIRALAVNKKYRMESPMALLEEVEKVLYNQIDEKLVDVVRV